MKKSILRLGALALMSMMSIGVWAQTFVENDNVYEVNQDKKTVALVSASKAMPSDGKVTYNEVEYEITKINDFAYRTKIQGGFTIPGTVTEVGVSALRGQEINNKSLPEFTSIGEYAFDGAKFTAQGATFEISCDLPKGAFYNAIFGAGTTIKLEQIDLTSLNDEVFALQTPNSEDGLTFVELPFTCVGKFKTVGTKAFWNRAKLAGFGYSSASTYFLPVALTRVEDFAFSGCSDLKLYFYDRAEYDGIRHAGVHAFNDCKKLDDAMFANICKSFENLSFYEGSFKGCSLTSVDLSNWTVYDYALEIGKGKDAKNFKGIPREAFYGNPITTLKYPANLEAIGNGAFSGNRLETISLPEGLLYVGENALKSADKVQAVGETPATQFTQDNLYLPKSLKQIFAGGIDNREIKNIYAWPTLKDNEGTYIPTIGAHTALNATLTIPVIAPYTSDQKTVTSKTLYTTAGWTSEKLTPGFKVQYPQKGGFTWGYDGVVYSTTSNTPEETYGYYTVNVIDFEAYEDRQDQTVLNPIIYGFIQAKSPQDYFWTEGTGKGYQYDVVCKVEYNNAVSNGFIKTVTLTPNAGLEILSTNFAQFFKNGYKLPTNAFKEEANLTSVTFGTGITAIPDNAFYGCTKLATVNVDTDPAKDGIQSDITSIGKFAFAGTKELKSIDLPSGLTSVGESAFADLPAVGEKGKDGYVEPRPAGLTSVTLPKTLEAINAQAFAAASINTVTVSYPADKIVELPENAFAYKVNNKIEDKDHFAAKLIVSGDKYARSAYLAESNNWKKFFADTRTFVEVVTKDKNATAEKTVCADENGVFNFADQVKAVKVTERIGTPAAGKTEASPVKVSYSRNLAENTWNPISLPFDVKVSEIKDAEVAELYNVRLNPETGALEAVVWVKLKGDDVMKAKSPYVIKPAEGKGKGWTLDISSIIETTYESDAYLSSSVNCMSTKEEYIIQSNFETVNLKEAYGYYISAKGFSYDNTGQSLNPYRLYMTRFDRVNNTPLYGGFENPFDPTEKSNVKVVVLGDEEEAATYINNVNINAESLNAPMFDLMGRQITSPAKGQVYIQNGVKKLAK